MSEPEEISARKDALRQAVAAEIAEQGLTSEEVSALGITISVDALTKFLYQKVWPQLARQGGIERAIGWPFGTMFGVAFQGKPIPPPRSSLTEEELIRERTHGRPWEYKALTDYLAKLRKDNDTLND